MSSIEEFKIIRLYRAYNTMLQLCHDRGYVVRHPSAVADAIKDPALYNREEDGLSYDWFLRHFVITPQQALAEAQRRRAGGEGKSHSKHTDKNEEDEERGGLADGGEDAMEDEELMQRAAGGEWIAMRNAMRLTCAVAPSGSGGSPTSSSASPVSLTAGADAGAPALSKEAKKRQKKDHNALMVFFSGANSLTVREIQDCREKALQKKASSMIMVANKVTAAVRRDVQELSGRLDPVTGAELLRIQVFEEESIAFNITQHETLPQHIPMTKAEADKFLQDRKLNISQLPRLLESDPVVQYLGLSRGDIVRVVRPSKESGPYDMYRQVI